MFVRGAPTSLSCVYARVSCAEIMSAFCSQTCVQPPCHPSLAAPSCGDLTVSTWYDSHLNLYEVEVGLDDAGAVEPVCHSLTLVAEDGGILVSKVFSGEDVVFIAKPPWSEAMAMRSARPGVAALCPTAAVCPSTSSIFRRHASSRAAGVALAPPGITNRPPSGTRSRHRSVTSSLPRPFF